MPLGIGLGIPGLSRAATNLVSISPEPAIAAAEPTAPPMN
jgi:hypothetical protein